jgi:hypothetical protein
MHASTKFFRSPLLFVAVLHVCWGCLACGPAEIAQSGRGAVMSDLRGRLERVRIANVDQPPAPFSVPYSGPILALVGASQAELFSGLGPPAWIKCEPSEPICSWGFSLYYLPNRRLGGGQEIIVHFDEHGRVRRVETASTQ